MQFFNENGSWIPKILPHMHETGCELIASTPGLDGEKWYM